MIKIIKKINLIKDQHLLDGNNGWSSISKELDVFHNKKGINCYEWLDKALKEKQIEGKWIGFLHNTITYPEQYPNKYSNKIMCLSEIIKNDYFLNKLKDCLGIFVFTKQIKDYLISKIKFTNIESLIHPGNDYGTTWNSFDFLLHAGQQLRKYHSFFDLKTVKKKYLIIPKNCEKDLIEAEKYSKNKDVLFINQLCLSEYLDKLCNSVVFLDLYDVAACNTIIECIFTNTPILVKKLEGCVEYLGEDYPFYFDELQEAEYKLKNKELIYKTNEYLKNIDKSVLCKNNFKFNFYKSKIFTNL